ncbi:hypothetical protein AURDEDRAFT_171431 [Auricularia subglabra TFB-10046 SS5]|nr:hypothetical protein AURDEDRAFT_171431 [Auricularia subglabra TFB-10046 SS5]
MALSYDKASQTQLPRLRAECHALFDACAAVFFRPRATDAFEKLRVQLKRNVLRCKRPASAHSHPTYGSAKTMDPLHALFDRDGVSNILHAGLHQGDRPALGRAWMPHKSFGDRHGRWPSRVAQLFPYGEQDTVNALLDLLDRQILFGPLGILNELLFICRTVVFPVLLAERNRARVIRAIVTLLDPEQRRGVASGMPWYGGGGHAMFTTAVGFLHIVFFGPGGVPGEAKTLYAGHERMLLTAIISGLEDVPDEQHEMAILAPIAIDIYHRMGVLFPFGIVMPARIVNWVRAEGEKLRPCFSRILLMLVSQTVKRRRCSAPGCGLAELEGGGGQSFQMCARCQVPRYCSKECQLRHWKGMQTDASRSLRHKDVCPVLCKVDAKSCINLTFEEFEVNYAAVAGGFTHDEKLVLNEFATTVGREFGYIFNDAELQTFPALNDA